MIQHELYTVAIKYGMDQMQSAVNDKIKICHIKEMHTKEIHDDIVK